MVQNQVEKQNQEYMMFILTWVCLKISLRQMLASRQLIAYRVSSQGIRTGNLEDWNKERGKAKVGMHYLADNSSGQLGLGPTGDTLRSHIQYIVITEEDRRAVHSSGHLSHTGQGCPWSRVLLFTCTSRFVHVSQWLSGFTKHPVQRMSWDEEGEISVFRGGKLPSDLSSLQIQQWLEYEMKWVEKMGEATEGFDAEEQFIVKVVFQKHWGNSILTLELGKTG